MSDFNERLIMTYVIRNKSHPEKLIEKYEYAKEDLRVKEARCKGLKREISQRFEAMKRLKLPQTLCITCGTETMINEYYKECEGCIEKYQREADGK